HDRRVQQARFGIGQFNEVMDRVEDALHRGLVRRTARITTSKAAMLIDDAVKREILARVDIASYIGGSVQLHKRGKDLVGLCPFHLEKTPSFHVHPDSGYYKCFGCGEGGDLFTFVMKHESVPF